MTQSYARLIPACGARVSFALLLAMAVFLSASRGHALAADAEIKIVNFTFDPPVLTIKAGTTVTWVNNDDIPHLVSEKDGKFRPSALDTGDKFSQAFSTAARSSISVPFIRT
jgi:plastocyanin